jgi:hypothetical protein
MTVLRLLRATAVAMASVAVLDPALSTTRLVPATVAVVVDPYTASSDELHAIAADVEARLRRRLGADILFNGDAEPAATVLIGERTRSLEIDRSVPTSTVMLESPAAPNIRVVALDSPAPVPVGWTIDVHATLEARGLSGTASRIVLEQEGIEIASLERKWSREQEHADVSLPYAPARDGIARLTVRVRPASGERRLADNALDVPVTAVGRRLKVVAYEPRPSWAAAFARRALEDHPSFDVSTLVRSSRRIAVRAGTPPVALSSATLDAFDAAIVGAPEDLTPADVAALETFARVRGGTVVFLPDRRPTGRYTDLLPRVDLEEVLVERPLELTTRVGRHLRASELVVPRLAVPAAETLATVQLKSGTRPVVFSQPLGAGAIVFSGALDAWRNRDAPADAFARFWQTTIADAALTAPSKIEIGLDPAIAVPGAETVVRARIRRTEMQDTADRTIVPSVHGRLIGPGGVAESIRFWPSPEPGVFEARAKVPPPGRYDVQVTAGGATADAILLSASDARPSPRTMDAERGARLLASDTGGVAVSPDDLDPLERHLRSLSKSTAQSVSRPARSIWFTLCFAALLCAEWLLRRRRGLA